MRPSNILPIFLILAFGLTACDSGVTNIEDDPVTVTVLVEDLAADPTVSTGGGRPTGSGRYTFFSLRDSSIVLSSSESNRSDSASTQWDIAFQSTNIIINGGTSGTGEGAGYVAEAAFSEVDEIDASEFVVDNAGTGTFAVPPGSGNGWYNYSGPPNHMISPIPGRTIVVRTADGVQYAKIRIISYYEGNPELPTENPSRYYTFEYVLLPEGETSFE